jgi:anti-sigma factor RsiW
MMHDSALHLSEDELHDAADGTRTPEPSSRAARHLAHCARCRADVDRIRELLALAAALPRSIDPPTDLWPGITARIHRGEDTGTSTRGRRQGSRWESLLRNPRWLAAAAVLLIVASSAITVMLVRPRGNESARAPDSVAPVAGPSGALPVRTVSDDYEQLDRELAQLLAAQRGRLRPETIAKVEHNIAIIDQAIVEIREALAADPGNEALRQLLKASYGQKSALVRQVSQS